MKRKAGLLLMVGGMLPLGVASTAWACASLATMKLESRNVQPGSQVSVTGRGFSDAHAGTTAGDSLVTIRLKTRDGAILQDNVDVTDGRIATTMRMPSNMSPGYYLLLATQTKADGTARAGTPARFAIKVSGTASQGVVASPWSNATNGPTRSAAGNGGIDSQPLLIGGILTLTLLAAGSVLVGRRNSHTMTLGA